ncbi:MAG: PDZ domain-containing protein [Gammaproteobacteria bacterium]
MPSSARSQTLGIRVESTRQQRARGERSQVVAGSPAQKAGIEVGDVITAVNDVVTIDPDVFDQAVGKAALSPRSA